MRSDLELINNIKNNNDSNSFVELSSRHTPLCYSIYNKYSSSIKASGMSLDDVKDDKDYVFYESVMSYDPTKNVKFTTWLGNNIRFQCLNAINHDGVYIALDDKDIQKASDKNLVENNFVKSYNKLSETYKDEYEYAVYIINQIKDKRIVDIFHLRYLQADKKPTWGVIAKQLGISVQMVINLHAKGLKLLKAKLSTKNIFDKI